jgi:hypothetical protein
VTVLTERLRLRPPLENAIAEFSEELRKELQRTSAALEALRAELAELRERYESHTHGYKGPPGEGGFLWFSLAQIRHYVEDGEDKPWDDHGAYLRGSPSTGDAPDIQTSPPV